MEVAEEQRDLEYGNERPHLLEAHEVGVRVPSQDVSVQKRLDLEVHSIVRDLAVQLLLEALRPHELGASEAGSQKTWLQCLLKVHE